MQLHTIQPQRTARARKRIGRGGKRGTTSGRGQKGQKSRAGHRMRPAERDIILRLPKRRGFKNRPHGQKPFPINLGLFKKFEGVVDKAALHKSGLWNSRSKREPKILGTGEILKPITIKGIKVSQSAKIKIEKAGGKVEP